MFLSKRASGAISFVKAISIIAICLATLMFSGECSKGAENGIRLCLTTLVPSLFPFMAVASYIFSSKAVQKAAKPFSGIMRVMFGLDGCFTPVILLSMIGGYPVGARAIRSLHTSGIANTEQCRRAALFAVCAGPGFLVNYIGVSLYNSSAVGAVLLAAQCMSVIFIGIILKFTYKNKVAVRQQTKPIVKSTEGGELLVKSVLDAAKSMLSICSFVVLFSAATGIFCSLETKESVQRPFLILTEVCSAVNTLSKDMPLELTAFAVGFGGLCVHFQIFSALGNVKVNKVLFFFVRILQGLFTAAFTHLGFVIFSQTTDVFSTSTVENAQFFGGTALSGAALLFTAVCFIYSLKNYKKN